MWQLLLSLCLLFSVVHSELCWVAARELDCVRDHGLDPTDSGVSGNLAFPAFIPGLRKAGRDLVAAARALPSAPPDLTAVPVENYHISITYFSCTGNALSGPIREALRSFEWNSFEVVLNRVGCEPGHLEMLVDEPSQERLGDFVRRLYTHLWSSGLPRQLLPNRTDQDPPKHITVALHNKSSGWTQLPAFQGSPVRVKLDTMYLGTTLFLAKDYMQLGFGGLSSVVAMALAIGVFLCLICVHLCRKDALPPFLQPRAIRIAPVPLQQQQQNGSGNGNGASCPVFVPVTCDPALASSSPGNSTLAPLPLPLPPPYAAPAPRDPSLASSFSSSSASSASGNENHPPRPPFPASHGTVMLVPVPVPVLVPCPPAADAAPTVPQPQPQPFHPESNGASDDSPLPVFHEQPGEKEEGEGEHAAGKKESDGEDVDESEPAILQQRPSPEYPSNSPASAP